MRSSKIKKPSPGPPETRAGQQTVQLVWGIALFLMGTAVIFRIPVVIDRLSAGGGASSGMHFLRFCFYLIAIILLGGGIRKINRYWFDRKSESKGDRPL